MTRLAQDLAVVALIAAVLLPIALLRAPDVVMLLSDGTAVGTVWVQQSGRGE